MPMLVLIGKRNKTGKDIFAQRLSRRLVNPHVIRISAPVKGAVFSSLQDADAFVPQNSDETRRKLIRVSDRVICSCGSDIYTKQAVQSFLVSCDDSADAAMIVPDWRYPLTYRYMLYHSRVVWDTIVLVLIRPQHNQSRSINHYTENDDDIYKIIMDTERCGIDIPQHVTRVVDVDYSTPSRAFKSDKRLASAVDDIVSCIPLHFVSDVRPISVYALPRGCLDLCNKLQSAGLNVVNRAINRTQANNKSILESHHLLSKSNVVLLDLTNVVHDSDFVPEELVIARMQNKIVVSVVNKDKSNSLPSLASYAHYYSSHVVDTLNEAIHWIKTVLSCTKNELDDETQDVYDRLDAQREHLSFGIEVA